MTAIVNHGTFKLPLTFKFCTSTYRLANSDGVERERVLFTFTCFSPAMNHQVHIWVRICRGNRCPSGSFRLVDKISSRANLSRDSWTTFSTYESEIEKVQIVTLTVCRPSEAPWPGQLLKAGSRADANFNTLAMEVYLIVRARSVKFKTNILMKNNSHQLVNWEWSNSDRGIYAIQW